MEAIPSSSMDADVSVHRHMDISPEDRLNLIGLMDKGMRIKASSCPITKDLFNNVSDLVTATISGSRINLLSSEASHGFRVFEIKTETGGILGRLDMLYLNKPIPCHYLVYVEVASHFRKKGLGNRILEHFRTYLDEKSTIGILDNIIPKDDPAYSIYFKNGWEPIQWITGENDLVPDDNYMIYIPPKLRQKNLREPVIKLLSHLKRKRTVIEMRDNEAMVKRTIEEFKKLYDALTAWFYSEIEKGDPSPFMRYMFTRYALKLISFQKRIGELIGYTGGESMEQFVLSPEIAAIKARFIAPRELERDKLTVNGDRKLWVKLTKLLGHQPALYLESLPHYQVPAYNKWMETKQGRNNEDLTIGDLIELGFDPTRYKEMNLDGEAFVVERFRESRLCEIEQKQEIMEQLVPSLTACSVKGTRIRHNPPIFMIHDGGNVYVIRRKISAIYYEDALEQLETDGQLREINQFLGLDRKILSCVKQATRKVLDMSGIEENTFFDHLSWYVSWDLTYNRPGLYMDFSESVIESLWLV